MNSSTPGCRRATPGAAPASAIRGRGGCTPVCGTTKDRPASINACTLENNTYLCGISGIGNEPGAPDAVDRAGLVIVRSVAADPDGAEDFPGLVADQHAARHRHDAPARSDTQRLNEGGVARGAAGELAPAEPHPQGAPGLAAGNLGPQQARPILAL